MAAEIQVPQPEQPVPRGLPPAALFYPRANSPITQNFGLSSGSINTWLQSPQRGRPLVTNPAAVPLWWSSIRLLKRASTPRHNSRA